jgi:hypothetical protein
VSGKAAAAAREHADKGKALQQRVFKLVRGGRRERGRPSGGRCALLRFAGAVGRLGRRMLLPHCAHSPRPAPPRPTPLHTPPKTGHREGRAPAQGRERGRGVEADRAVRQGAAGRARGVGRRGRRAVRVSAAARGGGPAAVAARARGGRWGRLQAPPPPAHDDFGPGPPAGLPRTYTKHILSARRAHQPGAAWRPDRPRAAAPAAQLGPGARAPPAPRSRFAIRLGPPGR